MFEFRTLGVFLLGSLVCGCLGPVAEDPFRLGDDSLPLQDPRVGSTGSNVLAPSPSPDPPSSPPVCGSLVEQRAYDPSCEYSFDLESCSATWECADGRVIQLQVRYDVDYGDHSCASELTCEGPGDVAMGACSLAPSTPMACPVEDEEQALSLCGPTKLVPLETDCAPAVDAGSSFSG